MSFTAWTDKAAVEGEAAWATELLLIMHLEQTCWTAGHSPREQASALTRLTTVERAAAAARAERAFPARFTLMLREHVLLGQVAT